MGDDTPVKDKVNIIKRLVKNFDEIKYDLMLAITEVKMIVL